MKMALGRFAVGYLTRYKLCATALCCFFMLNIEVLEKIWYLMARHYYSQTSDRATTLQQREGTTDSKVILQWLPKNNKYKFVSAISERLN
jgi:hypothetical protein